MRLFISYARVDKPFCIQIVDTLDVHEVWYDHRLHVGQKWWDEILRRLSWCDGLIYLLSPESVQSLYCQKELAIAYDLGKHIFPVLIQADTPIPDGLRDVQYVDLSKGLDVQAVKGLLNSIYLAEREAKPLPTASTSLSPVLLLPPPFDPTVTIYEAAAALDAGNFDRAVFLLKQAQSHGYEPRFINLPAMLEEAETALNQQTYQREIEREYLAIATLVKQKVTYRVGCEAFLAFQRNFPDYDPENLADMCLRPAPLIEWCDIPAGKITVVESKNKTTQMVAAFRISKYPVSNAQYQAFIDALDGYQDERWWEYAPHVLHWHRQNPVPLAATFPGDLYPRGNVAWYEAVAFCKWMGFKTGLPVMLPTDCQWQRAAQGDHPQAYPWGKKYDSTRCNTRESGIKRTTPVNTYANGISPFGVYDLIGNVWEWCITWQPMDKDGGAEGEIGRMVRGGSFVSPQQRSDTTSYFILKPVYRYASIGFRLVYATE